MNRKIELAAYLAELRFRKRHEHPHKRAAKRAIRTEIKNTKLRMKYAERDFDKFMKKAGRRSRRTPNPKIQFAWFMVLLVMVAICAACAYVFINYREQLMTYAGQYFAQLTEAVTNAAGNLPQQ
jgi:hypothetical protein